MATIVRIDLLQKQINAIRKSSKGVAKLLHQQLAAVEQNPSAFEELRQLPDWLERMVAGRKDTWVRKVKVTHGKHDYRLVFLHRRPTDRNDEYVDFFYAGKRRQDDYRSIDWDMIMMLLSED